MPSPLFPSPLQPSQLTGCDIDSSDAQPGYANRHAAKVFGTPAFTAIESIPGILLLPCTPHLLSTTVSIVLEWKRTNLGLGEFFCEEGAALVKKASTIASHLHQMGGAKKVDDET